MILKTRIEVREEDLSKLTEAERDKYEAKRDVLGDKFTPDDELFVSKMIDAVIDTYDNVMYVDGGDGTVVLKPLLSSDLITTEDGGGMYLYPTVVFEGTINKIYRELKNDRKQSNNN